MALTDKLTAIANAIREKTGGTELLTLDQMPTEIAGIETGGGGGGNVPAPDDGKTRIYITLPEGRTSPMLGVCPNGTVTVDWGDGTEPNVLTGTSTTSVKWTPTHNYASAGDYVISLTVDGEMGFYGSTTKNNYTSILRHSSSSDVRNAVYQTAVKKITIGGGVTSIGKNAFIYCYGLGSVAIPNSVTSIGMSAFYYCASLASVAIPNSVTDVAGSVFGYCYGLRYVDFSNHTSVPTISSASVFENTPADLEIRVPAALYDEWIAATNWSSLASKIVAV